ncbi:hypothetical protein QQ045_000375 [Rhodiola kirilowii]
MSATSVAANLNNIPILNRTNFEEWKENIKIFLGSMYLDLALREAKPIHLANSRSAFDRHHLRMWEHSNRMSLMIIHRGIPEAFRREKWTLNELISFCVEEEEMLKHDEAGNSKAPVFNTHIICHFCEETGHVKMKCPKWAKYIAWRVKRGLSKLPMTY